MRSRYDDQDLELNLNAKLDLQSIWTSLESMKSQS